LFVFAWLVVGGEETEVRLLARNLDPARYRVEVVACFRKSNMPEQTYRQLKALGVPVDCTPYDLSFEDTVAYLAEKIPGYDVVVGCQAVPDLYPALEMMGAENRPPLIEHGGLVEEAVRGQRYLTSRYVGVCSTIRDAARTTMPERPEHALSIPSMIDLAEFNGADRERVRKDEWGIEDANTPVIGWAGRLDRKKRVEDFIAAAARVRRRQHQARFVAIGGPDAFMPEYSVELEVLAERLGLSGVLTFMGDREDLPRLMAGLDIFVWLSRGEGMPHVISEAGAASLPVVATRDNGSEEQISDWKSGIFVPHEAPEAVADAICALIEDPTLRQKLGSALREKVASEYSTRVVVREGEELFDEVKREGPHLSSRRI
jgi:glycosyltransferase involved in cell wall biosynthesis